MNTKEWISYDETVELALAGKEGRQNDVFSVIRRIAERSQETEDQVCFKLLCAFLQAVQMPELPENEKLLRGGLTEV